jgi:hypothetical protein
MQLFPSRCTTAVNALVVPEVAGHVFTSIELYIRLRDDIIESIARAQTGRITRTDNRIAPAARFDSSDGNYHVVWQCERHRDVWRYCSWQDQRRSKRDSPSSRHIEPAVQPRKQVGKEAR